MKIKTSYFLLILVLLGMSIMSCNQTPQSSNSTKHTNVVLSDYGDEPTVLNIEAYTMMNNNFRLVLWTGAKFQVTLMSIPVGCDIGLEQHPETDQFLRIEDGEAKVLMGDSEESLDFIRTAEKDFAIIVPAGKWHNIINTGDIPLKLYSIYAPIEHPFGTVHKTQEEEEHH